MPAIEARRWALCVDGGGTAAKAVVVDDGGTRIGRGVAGACNVKSVGAQGAIAAILAAARAASVDAGLPALPPFERVWLGLAGVLHQADIDAFAPFACEAFGFAAGDARLRITNDGHLLASPCLRLPHIDSTVAIVAGTGSVGLAFRKNGGEIDLVGRAGGWGYLLGDEGSAYAVSRLAITRLLAHDDTRISSSLANPASVPLPTLPLFDALLSHLGVPDAAALVDRTYADHAPPSAPPSFTSSETTRKLWIAEAARVVFSFAYERADADEASRAMALSIVEEAMLPLVDTVVKLVGARKVIEPERAVLALGGGMWKAEGYRRLMEDGLRRKGIVFGEVRTVDSAAEEGAMALRAQAEQVQ
ncbi:hypothetical protein JCM10213_008624 [Rhodosporidiobolus nylandii]